MIGLGTNSAQLKVYIKNLPPTPPHNNLMNILTIKHGDINAIVSATGNHWRKIFNVYAKLIFSLNTKGLATWQVLRDEYLFQLDSDESLIFSSPDESLLKTMLVDTGKFNPADIHIIMGKTYANELGISEQCEWLSADFAIHQSAKVIICPYFDYRQLSNIKIEKLAQLIRQLQQA